MGTITQVNVGVRIIKNEDSTYLVQKISNTENYINAKILSQTNWAISNEWKFKNEKEALEFFGRLRMALEKICL